MSAAPPPRRVVTGVDAEGRSCILFDDAAPLIAWAAPKAPADNSGTADTGSPVFGFPASGSSFTWGDLAPGMDSGWHATETIDYIVVVSGEITFVTESGETILRAGDVAVDRGVQHAWRNHTDQPCRMVVAFCPATPLASGKGT